MSFFSAVESIFSSSSSSSAPISTDDAIARAKTTLGYYHNAALAGFPEKYPFQSFDELLARFASIDTGFLLRYGKADAIAVQLDETDRQAAMGQVASITQGFPPVAARDLTIFYDALSNSLQNWSLAKWTREIGTATADVAKTATGFALGGAALYALAIGGLFILAVSRR